MNFTSLRQFLEKQLKKNSKTLLNARYTRIHTHSLRLPTGPLSQLAPPISLTEQRRHLTSEELTDGEVLDDTVTTISFALPSRIQRCRRLELLWPLARAAVLMVAQGGVRRRSGHPRPWRA